MKVLAIDTSTMMATCAVLEDDNILGEYSLSQKMSHSENLVPMIKEVLDNLSLEIKDIDLYAVAIGPGSFTGLRIGIATMKGFAHVYNKPIIGVSTLEGLAYNLNFDGMLVPIIDARRDRVYTGIYRWEKGKLVNILEPTIMKIDKLLELIDRDYDNVIINGNGVHIHKEKILSTLGSKVRFAAVNSNECRATSIAELGLLKQNEDNKDNYYNLIPEYIRESQAQRELKKKESGN